MKIIEHESSHIKKSKWILEERELFVEFHNGGIYTYIDVNLEDYLGFIQSESVGKGFNEYIKKYEFTKIE